MSVLTSKACVVLQVLAPSLDVQLDELLDAGASLAYGVVGSQAEDGHELERQPQGEQALVQLVGKVHPHVKAAVL